MYFYSASLILLKRFQQGLLTYLAQLQILIWLVESSVSEGLQILFEIVKSDQNWAGVITGHEVNVRDQR